MEPLHIELEADKIACSVEFLSGNVQVRAAKKKKKKAK